ncbi:MAG: FkbM family methyltransferase, partial [Actinomycetota bacterium]
MDLVSLPPDAGVQVRELHIAGVDLVLSDFEGSVALDVIGSEIGTGAYDFSDIDFRPGDVVVDIGGHVGSVSIWLAKAHPFLRIVTFEPLPPLFALLQRNLERNGVRNVTALNRAVTGDGRDLEMVAHFGTNTGGGTAQLRYLDMADHDHFVVPSSTLDDVLDEFGIGHLKLLKIDCEGSEYEVLFSSRRVGDIEHVRGEFHENPYLREKGYSMEALERYIER